MQKKRRISKKDSFLAAFALTGRVFSAARAARIDRALHYRWMAESEDYRKRFELALQQAADTWEEEAIRRANEGTFRPNSYKGEHVYAYKTVVDPQTGEERKVQSKMPYGVREYSDTLLMFLLRGAMPNKYRERGSVEVSGSVKHLKFDGSMMELLALHRELAAKANADE